MSEPSGVSGLKTGVQKGNQTPRRALLQGAALAASLFADTGPALGRRKASATAAAPSLLAGIGVADAQTTTGRIAGYRHQGMFVFKGIPYAIAPRMGLPVSHPSWGGVRSSKQYGAVCPQQPRNTWIFDDVAWMYDWNDGHANEDCLNLNVWTPALADGGKRPVMVWLHGGGFEAGSSHELKAYDGESLSRRGDVVVISPNHRVGVLGFLAVSGTIAGEAIDGANLGMLDLVAALHWARDNAAAFGGDPNNVTLFGQSGGGGKINALMAMPAAQGLFHRAISQSAAFPSYRHMATPEVSAKLAKVVLDTLGIPATDLAKLRAVPLDQFMQAGGAAQKAFRVPWKPDVIDASLTWGPTVDGKVLPEAPFAAAAPAISRDIPLLLGTVQNEFSPALYDPSLLQLTDAGLQQRVAALHGPRADQVLAAFRAAHPQATPVELISLISSSVFRRNVLEQASMKAAQGGAPAWLYLFDWKTPLLNGRAGAFHCSDLPFMFDNTDRAATMTGGGSGPRELAAKMTASWISFARSGNPGLDGLTDWKSFTQSGKETMVINNSPSLRRNLDDKELASLV